jgi:hypothetical protein
MLTELKPVAVVLMTAAKQQQQQQWSFILQGHAFT